MVCIKYKQIQNCKQREYVQLSDVKTIESSCIYYMWFNFVIENQKQIK